MKPSNYAATAKRYAEQVVAGEILACRWVQRACQRQLDDLAKFKGKASPYLFNPKLTDKDGRGFQPADNLCAFIERLPHVKGPLAGEPIQLEPWQAFILTTVFGWVKPNGTRRFQVDKWALYRVAQYCDQLVPNGLGGFEPRFTCNLYLQTREQAYKVVQDMASIFRGMVYWSGGAITVTQDAPADPVYQFAPSNVVDGEFAYQGSAAKARHTVALVTWNDPEDFYRQKVEYVEDAAGIARYGIVQSEVVALGCTSRGQAHRVGKWLLYSEQSESEIVTFRTGLEGAVMRPGDVIKVADPVRGGMRLGGRIAAASASTVTLDQDLPADLPWRLSVILPTGAVEERLVGPISGRALTVTIPFSAVPQAGAIWVLSSTIIEPQLFRVVAVAERDPGVHEVTALAHNPSKFDAIEKGLALQPRSITVLSDMPTVYLEAVSGVLPRARVTTIQGTAAVPVFATGLSPGEQVRIKAGWKYFPGVDDITIEVV